LKVKSKNDTSDTTADPTSRREVGNEDGRMEHRAQVGVECPQCHWRQFVEVNLDKVVADSPYGREIQAHIQEWLRSRCPDHLGTFLKYSKN